MRKGTFKTGNQEWFMSAVDGEVISMESKPKVSVRGNAIRQQDRTHIFVRQDDGKEIATMVPHHLNHVRAGSRVSLIFAGKVGDDGKMIAIQTRNPAGVTEVVPLMSIYDPLFQLRVVLFIFGLLGCAAHGVGIILLIPAGVWQWFSMRRGIIFNRTFKTMVEVLNEG